MATHAKSKVGKRLLPKFKRDFLSKDRKLVRSAVIGYCMLNQHLYTMSLREEAILSDSGGNCHMSCTNVTLLGRSRLSVGISQ